MGHPRNEINRHKSFDIGRLAIAAPRFLGFGFIVFIGPDKSLAQNLPKWQMKGQDSFHSMLGHTHMVVALDRRSRLT